MPKFRHWKKFMRFVPCTLCNSNCQLLSLFSFFVFFLEKLLRIWGGIVGTILYILEISGYKAKNLNFFFIIYKKKKNNLKETWMLVVIDVIIIIPTKLQYAKVIRNTFSLMKVKYSNSLCWNTDLVDRPAILRFKKHSRKRDKA